MADFVSTTDVVGSNMGDSANPNSPRRAPAGYGDMYDDTQSSLTPKQKGGKSNFLGGPVTLPAENANGQTRSVSAEPYPNAMGQRNASANPVKIGAKLPRAILRASPSASCQAANSFGAL